MTLKISTVYTAQWVNTVGGPQVTIIYSHFSMKKGHNTVLEARICIPIVLEVRLVYPN